jgi:hypothetical protein
MQAARRSPIPETRIRAPGSSRQIRIPSDRQLDKTQLRGSFARPTHGSGGAEDGILPGDKIESLSLKNAFLDHKRAISAQKGQKMPFLSSKIAAFRVSRISPFPVFP